MLDSPPVALETVVVSATRAEARAFDVPAAISSVDAQSIRDAGPQVNLSESIARVPGITALNRQNYAQDVQLSIRGFGARSTFGIRGVRVLVDGIPATMPDGQGQVSNIVLASTARIEVLRGPLAILYGNAAGGVVQVFTQAGAAQPTVSASAAAARYGTLRYGAGYAASSGAHGIGIDASHFETDGYRRHAGAERNAANAKWSWQWSGATRIDTVLNVFDQPLALDPLGLTRAQWQQDPRQAPAIAFTQDASKTVRQQQLGSVVHHEWEGGAALEARLYGGTRDLDNKLSTPLASQLPPTSSGGIVSFDRVYYGGALQLSRGFAFGTDSSARIVAAVEYDHMKDDRQGYINNAGVRGVLRRDEDDIVHNSDALLQATLDWGKRWSAVAGVRASSVRFDTRDRYVAPGNPDDSGTLAYRATNPVGGITWHASPEWNVYANAGRGFETPTFTELAYRNAGSGLNAQLRAARGDHFELGAKGRPAPGHGIEGAIFDIRTRDEIVVDTNNGGRTTFRNAGGTKRRGVEAMYQASWTPWLRSYASVTALNARFDDGRRLPGTPERSAFAELVVAPRESWHAAIEAMHLGRIYVNDANDDLAPSWTVLNLRIGGRVRWGGLDIEPLLRVDNATDRHYAGSVIVNEAQRRFFEPAPGRTWMFSVVARYRG